MTLSVECLWVYSWVVIIAMNCSWPFVGGQFEEVGVLIGRRFGPYACVRSCVPVPNRSSTPEERFTVWESDLPALRVSDGKVIGFAHTHPRGQAYPSRDDMDGLGPGMLGAIWCSNGNVSWYDRSGALSVTIA